jgi:hypothetical protein
LSELRARGARPPTVAAPTAAAISAPVESVSYSFASYYPGTGSDGAVKLNVAPGEIRSGVDFSIVMGGQCRIGGRVLGVDGDPVDGATVRAGTAVVFGASAKTAGDGSFTIEKLPAASYLVTVDAGSSWTTQVMSAVCGDVARPILQLRPKLSVTGRVIVDRGSLSSTPPALSEIRVWLSSSAPTGAPVSANAQREGDFEIGGLLGVTYAIRVSGLPPDWRARSVMFEGRDLLDEPLDLASAGTDVSGVVVTITNRRTGLSGTLSTRAGEPAVSYFVAVIPQDAALWAHPKSRRFAVTRPASNGQYAFRDLPAGDYWIGVLTDAPDNAWQTPAILAELSRSGQHVIVRDGETTTHDLRVGASRPDRR